MTSVNTPIAKASLIVVLPLLLLATLLILNRNSSIAAAMTEPIRARTVQGFLPGGAFAQIWLGLEPEFADAQITVLAEWDRLQPADNGLNFFIFDEQQLRRLGEGNNSFSSLALAAGSAGFALSTPENVVGAGFRATGWAAYALVVINESAQAATFTLRVTNGFVTDVANQVTVLDPLGQPSPTPVNTTPPVMTPTPLVTTSLFTVPTPIAATVSTPFVTATVTAMATPTAPLQPAPRTSLGVNKRQLMIKGALTTTTEQHLLRIKPNKANSQLLLRLTMDSAPSAALGPTTGLNFWVFDEVAFSQYLTGVTPETLAFTTGKAVFRGASNERVAGFRATDTLPYTVVIYSSQTTLPISYTLRIEGAQVLENFYLP